jgi:hypothetical protein
LLSDSTAVKRNKDNEEEDTGPLPKLESVKKLEEIATSKLAEIVRQFGSGNKTWAGLDEAEVIAAKELLNREGKIER